MKRRQHCIERTHPTTTVVRCAAWTLAWALCGTATCRADSTVHSATSTGGALTATAHLDFVVTVLPMVSLSTQATGMRVLSNGGTLTLQRNAPGRWDGRPPNSALILPSDRRGVDATVAAPSAGAELLTVAAP